MKRKLQLVGFSKSLRSESTLWERKLWYYLRGGRFLGLKFKRQVVIDDYIVDFSCNEKKVVIEVDGSQHNSSKGIAKDKIRDNHLSNAGYKVLRFWDDEIDKNIEGVLERIRQTL